MSDPQQALRSMEDVDEFYNTWASQIENVKYDGPSPWPPLKGRQEIRLLSLTSDPSATQLQCTVTVMSLSNEDQYPAYAALSYNWTAKVQRADVNDILDQDDPKNFKGFNIHCNGAPCFISANLEAALRAVWRRSPQTLLWVDALSIDQRDTSERNHQVSLMSLIFGCAAEVLVWLGDEGPLGSDTMSWAWSIIEKADSEPEGVVETVKQALPDHCPPQQRALYQALRDISRRGWFRRAWCFQEIMLAKHALVLCNDLFMDWTVFTRGCANLADLVEPLQWLRESFVELDTCRAGCQAHTIPLSRLLFLTRDRKATDPRDKVFALLGLVPDSVIKADYSRDVEAVYLSMTRQCIAEEQTLAILDLAGLEWQSKDVFFRSKFLERKGYRGNAATFRTLDWSDSTWTDHLRTLHSSKYSRIVPRNSSPKLEFSEMNLNSPFRLAGYFLGRLKVLGFGEHRHVSIERICRCVTQSAAHRPHAQLQDVFERWPLQHRIDPLTVITSLKHHRAGKCRYRKTTSLAQSHRSLHSTQMPEKAETDDWLCILSGGTKPYVLRPCVEYAEYDPDAYRIRQVFDASRKHFELVAVSNVEGCDEAIQENVPSDWADWPCIETYFDLV